MSGIDRGPRKSVQRLRYLLGSETGAPSGDAHCLQPVRAMLLVSRWRLILRSTIRLGLQKRRKKWTHFLSSKMHQMLFPPVLLLHRVAQVDSTKSQPDFASKSARKSNAPTRRALQPSSQRDSKEDVKIDASDIVLTEPPTQKVLQPSSQMDCTGHEPAELKYIPSKFDDVCTSDTKKPVILEPINHKVYQGVVTWFRGSYGWIVSEAVAIDYPGCDIMVHKNDCNHKLCQGSSVCFRLALNDLGNPQAVKVSKPADVINARDWFSARDSQRLKTKSKARAT